jgi:hypothetical protein
VLAGCLTALAPAIRRGSHRRGGRHHWGGRDGGAGWGRQSCQEQSREEREMVAVERIKDDRWDLHVWWKNFS